MRVHEYVAGMRELHWALPPADERHARLLEYLSDKGRGFQALGEFYDHDDSRLGEALRDVKQLLDRKQLKAAIEPGGVDAVAASLEPQGARYVENIREARARRVPRRWALRQGLLSWLTEEGAVGSSRSVTWDGFDGDLRSRYYGDTFQSDERDAAAAWLQRQGLIDGINVAEMDGPVRAFLTDEGERCSERFKCNVEAYIESKERRGVGSTIWNVTGQQVQVATGPKSKQKIIVGPTADEVKLGLQGVAELVAELRRDAATEKRAAELVKEAVDDLDSDEPTGEPARRFLEWAKECVQEGGTAAVVAAVTAMSSGLLADIERLVGAAAGG